MSADWFAGLARALLPRRCPGCDAQLGREAGLCAACRAGLRPQVERHSPLEGRPVPHLVTLGAYRGVTRRSVRALKYGGARDLAGVLGGAIASGVPAGWQVAAVVPAPMHAARQRERGFNQAELLAQAVARGLGVPCVPAALRRTRATAAQAKRHANERADLHAFIQGDPHQVPRGPILLVDDVLTTGKTMLACRDALLDAGARPLYYAVVAR